MTQLVHFDAARRELALATSIDEVKMLRDKAEALRQYVRQQGASLEMQNQCAEIKLRAERKAGELLAGVERIPGLRTDLTSRHDDAKSYRQTLDNADVKEATARRWQAEASVPEGVFERHVAEVKAAGEELTSVGVVQLASRLRKQEAIRGLATIEQTLDGTVKYRCIVIDPPWPMQKIEREVRPYQGQAVDYPTMTREELEKLDIGELAEADGCFVFLWTTQRFLPVAFDLLDYWGFHYILTMVWHKTGGFQPFGLPQYNCEFVLLGRQGNLPFLDTKDFWCCFEGARREHSRKPDEFYRILKRVCAGPRLDMFARESHDGFEVWGNETDRF